MALHSVGRLLFHSWISTVGSPPGKHDPATANSLTEESEESEESEEGDLDQILRRSSPSTHMPYSAAVPVAAPSSASSCAAVAEQTVLRLSLILHERAQRFDARLRVAARGIADGLRARRRQARGLLARSALLVVDHGLANGSLDGMRENFPPLPSPCKVREEEEGPGKQRRRWRRQGDYDSSYFPMGMREDSINLPVDMWGDSGFGPDVISMSSSGENDEIRETQNGTITSTPTGALEHGDTMIGNGKVFSGDCVMHDNDDGGGEDNDGDDDKDGNVVVVGGRSAAGLVYKLGSNATDGGGGGADGGDSRDDPRTRKYSSAETTQHARREHTVGPGDGRLGQCIGGAEDPTFRGRWASSAVEESRPGGGGGGRGGAGMAKDARQYAAAVHFLVEVRAVYTHVERRSCTNQR